MTQKNIPPAMWISRDDFARYNAASRMMEDDLEEAYLACRNKYGAEVAGVLLVSMLRDKFNDKKHQWPPPDGLPEKVVDYLVENNLMIEKTFAKTNLL